MQQSPSPSNLATGELISTFRHGKGFLIFTLVFAVVLLALAGFVLYLSSILPATDTGPVSVHTSRGMNLNFSSPQALTYFISGTLAVIGVAMFGIYVWQKKLRRDSYEVYEHGIAHDNGAQKHYTAFSEIEDLYLFSSGQTAMTGMITNLAYRRNASEPFQRVIESLKGFQDFQQLVRELYIRERLPNVLNTLQAGGVVAFNYISSGQVWRKRMTGNFLNITTQPILVTRDFLEVQGRKVPMSSLRTVDLSAWTEKVVIKDETGKQVLSSIATGILSHDLFLNTLDAIIEVQEADRRHAAPIPA